MDDECVHRTQLVQHSPQHRDPARRVHTHDLVSGERWICERPEQVEHRSHAQLATDLSHHFERGMMMGSEQEANSNLIDAFFHMLERDRQIDPQGEQHVRRTAARRDRTVAVLGHHHARSRGDEGGSG